MNIESSTVRLWVQRSCLCSLRVCSVIACACQLLGPEEVHPKSL